MDDDFLIKTNSNGVKNYLFEYNGNNTNIIIPLTVEAIGYRVFSDKDICNVVFNNSIHSIYQEAFCNCLLSTIDLPCNLKLIENKAFYGNQLTKITIPSSVTEINYSAFDNNPLETIYISQKCYNNIVKTSDGDFEKYNSICMLFGEQIIYSKGKYIILYENKFFGLNIFYKYWLFNTEINDYENISSTNIKDIENFINSQIHYKRDTLPELIEIFDFTNDTISLEKEAITKIEQIEQIEKSILKIKDQEKLQKAAIDKNTQLFIQEKIDFLEKEKNELKEKIDILNYNKQVLKDKGYSIEAILEEQSKCLINN